MLRSCALVALMFVAGCSTEAEDNNGAADSSLPGVDVEAEVADAATDTSVADASESVDAAPEAWPTALRWDASAAPGPQYVRARADLLASCGAAIKALDALEAPVYFADEGLLSTDPKRQASQAIWTVLATRAPTIGYCARLPGPRQTDALRSIRDYLAKLVAKYKGGGTDASTDNDDPGNPINELRLTPFLFALDMVYGGLTPAEQANVGKLLDGIDTRVAAFMAGLNSTDKRRKNNWMMHALTLRTYAALIARNATKGAAIKTTINAFVASSFTTPGGFMLSSCSNLRAIGVYGSYDLQERDAFKYHMAGLQDPLELGTLEPTFLDGSALTAATNALNLLKDYVSGAKVHNEFVCSTVAFDRERADAGTPGFSGPYVPSSSKEAFRYGRIVVPASRSWTSSLATADYSDWLKVLVSGRGDEIVY